LINLSGVYHYDARGATAEYADLFGSLIYRREGPEELLLEPDVFDASIVAKRTHASALPQYADSLIMPQMATRRTVQLTTLGRARRRADSRID
jgi:hypothetical protein